MTPRCLNCHQELELTRDYVTLYRDLTTIGWAFIEITCSGCLEDQPGLGFIDPDELVDWADISTYVTDPIATWAVKGSDLVVQFRRELEVMCGDDITMELRPALKIIPTPIPRPRQCHGLTYEPVEVTCHCGTTTVADPIQDDIVWSGLIRTAVIEVICRNDCCQKPVRRRLSLPQAVSMAYATDDPFFYFCIDEEDEGAEGEVS